MADHDSDRPADQPFDAVESDLRGEALDCVEAGFGPTLRERLAIDRALGADSPAPALGRALDPKLAAETEAVLDLFTALRNNLTCEPTGRVAVALQQAVARRDALLRDPVGRGGVLVRMGTQLGLRRVLHFALRAAAVAALLIEGQVVLGRLGNLSGPGLGDVSRANQVVSAAGSEFAPVPPLRPLAQASHDDRARGVFAGSETGSETTVSRLSSEFAQRDLATKATADRLGGGVAFAAENQLALRCLELELCTSPLARRALLEGVGDASLTQARIESLSAQIAEKVTAAFLVPPATHFGSVVTIEPRDLALVVRALVASGSTVETGPHATALRAVGHALADSLSSLRDADLTYALAALSELAALHDFAAPYEGRARELFSQHAGRLSLAILSSTFAQPCELLTWGCDSGALAEAGAVLRVAAAFGVPAEAAYQARLLLLAHLQERAERLIGERPGLAAAILYGFGDVVERKPWEHRLRLWHARDFLPDGAALLHFAWSKGAVGSGWADFQHDLRILATEPTPEGIGDQAGLLLALATTFAAPGAHSLQTSIER